MLNKLNELRNKREEGFTLIELLVVIAIIGVLAAIALPIFLNQQKEAAKASVKSDVHNTVTSIASYLVENPNAIDLQTKAVVSTGNSVSVSGSGSSYQVCASDPAAPNFTYGFDSTTGQYSQGCTVGAGATTNNGGSTPTTNPTRPETFTNLTWDAPQPGTPEPPKFGVPFMSYLNGDTIQVTANTNYLGYIVLVADSTVPNATYTVVGGSSYWYHTGTSTTLGLMLYKNNSYVVSASDGNGTTVTLNITVN